LIFKALSLKHKSWEAGVHKERDVQIKSRDYWFKVVDFLQANWALIDEAEDGVIVWFFDDTSGVFDEMTFLSLSDASEALEGNRFQRYAEDPEAGDFVRVPMPPFYRSEHSNGKIYSSGRFWR
jgi:hypothetical protein